MKRSRPAQPTSLQDEPCRSTRPSDEDYSTGLLLERLMHARCLPSRRLRRVHDPAELSIRLQQIICLIGRTGALRAYTDDTQWWFAVSRHAALTSADWTFDTWFFSQDGALCGAASWRYSPVKGFLLAGIPGFEPSSECTVPTDLEHATH